MCDIEPYPVLGKSSYKAHRKVSNMNLCRVDESNRSQLISRFHSSILVREYLRS